MKTMYTEDFIKRIHDRYPYDDYINRLATEGKWELGRALRLASEGEIAHTFIIAADSLEELQRASIDLQLRKGLYTEFMCGHGSVPCRDQARLLLDKENRIKDQTEKDFEEAG